MTPRAGDIAPGFTAPNGHGEQVTLAGLRGAPVLLFFYPWAFSRLCHGELAALRDEHARLADQGVRVLAISCDAMFTLRAYSDAEKLPFDLLSDHWPHGEVARSYGVFDEQAGCGLRGTFLVDAEGAVRFSQLNGIGEPREIATLVSELVRLAPSTRLS